MRRNRFSKLRKPQQLRFKFFDFSIDAFQWPVGIVVFGTVGDIMGGVKV